MAEILVPSPYGGGRIYADFNNEHFYAEVLPDAPEATAGWLARKTLELGLEPMSEDGPAELVDGWMRVWCAEIDGGVSRGL